MEKYVAAAALWWHRMVACWSRSPKLLNAEHG